MDKQPDHDASLAAPLAALRAEVERLNAPRCVEKELMQAFARQFPRRRWYHRLSTPAWRIGASCAGVALAVLALVLAPRGADSTGSVDSIAPLVGSDSSGGVFIALESLERIEQEPRPRLVEANVPRTALASLGVDITPENAGDTVRAEMLVATNGEPLALRLTSLN